MVQVLACSDAERKGVPMSQNIHPKYEVVKVQCSCGHEFHTRSTFPGETLKVEVCSECHPFYTGKHKIVDTEGRVDQFMRRYANKQSQAAKPALAAPEAKAAKKSTKAKTTKKKKETKQDES